MKYIYLFLLSFVCLTSAFAQVTITAADMPVAGDTLRYSIVIDSGTINTSITGPSSTWDFSNLNLIAQGVDTYKTATQVNPVFGLTISPAAYGYKFADSIPGIGSVLPVSVSALYTFYSKKTSPARFVAEGFGATVGGVPTPAAYQDEDEVYFFPLAYGSTNDSSTFRLNQSLPNVGSIKQKGYRKTKVDGWGTIVTPYFTTPTSCIRVRSEIHEIDSVTLTSFPIPIGLPRNSVEYKWLVPGEHYPALEVVAQLTGGAESITSVTYRDSARNMDTSTIAVQKNAKNMGSLKVYPNPASGNTVNISIPADWQNYTAEIFDINGEQIAAYLNKPSFDIASLPAGNYIIRVTSGSNTAYGHFVK